jgi:hypothetical protein
MAPWDQPPFPKHGNSEAVLFEAIGRTLMAWEEVEGAFAHLYSTFLTGWPFDIKSNRQYGMPLNFVHRVQGLEKIACRYFQRKPLAMGWGARRNDVAHGRARFIHWVLDPNSPQTLLSKGPPLRWCAIPPHFKGDKFTPDNKPSYVLTSREMRRFTKAFWDLARQTNSFMHAIEVPSAASYGRSTLLHP